MRINVSKSSSSPAIAQQQQSTPAASKLSLASSVDKPALLPASTSPPQKTFSIMITNQDGTNKNVLTTQAYPLTSPNSIVIGQSSSSNSRVANYYKKLNDASYQSQFEPRNCGGENSSCHRRHHGKDSSRKKKKSGNVSRERTNSDSGMNL